MVVITSVLLALVIFLGSITDAVGFDPEVGGH
jgi:hypothetical protein